jgi:hypothetical protein
MCKNVQVLAKPDFAISENKLFSCDDQICWEQAEKSCSELATVQRLGLTGRIGTGRGGGRGGGGARPCEPVSAKKSQT